MKIKVMVAEDERLAREELEFLLSKFADLELCPSANNGNQLLQNYVQHRPDVLFLDIQMPEITGIELAQTFRSNHHTVPLIIFTTAYDHYAVEAFQLQALDYLLKPIDEKRLEEAIQRIRKEWQHRQAESHSAIVMESSLQKTTGADLQLTAKLSKLVLDDGEKMVVIDPSSIYYIVKEERIVRVFTKNKEYHTKITLQELEDKLKNHYFFRSHRSYLVNLLMVEEILPWFNGAYNLILRDLPQVKIPVSRSAAKELIQKLQI